MTYLVVVKCEFGGGTRSRTEIHGFAIRCIAILPFRRCYLLACMSCPGDCPFFIQVFAPAVKTKKPCRTGFQQEIGAGNEIRTRDPNLGKVVLYQLSYSRALEADGYSSRERRCVKNNVEFQEDVLFRRP